jgi:hypothetical protein
MTSQSAGRAGVFSACLSKSLLIAAAIAGISALGACTTDEGTNALVSPYAFEHEVMDPTLQGLDILPPDPSKPPPKPRAPLVMPKQTAQLPQPAARNPAAAALPTDSTDPKISTAGLSQADLARLRDARVIDLSSLNGRALTDSERRQLAAQLAAANKQGNPGSRPLTLPPASYFASYKGANAVCKAADGTLVALNDPRCPDKIQHALRRQMPVGGSVTQDINNEEYDMANGIDPNDPNEAQYAR